MYNVIRSSLFFSLLDCNSFGFFYTSSNLMTPYFFIIVGYVISFVLEFWITLLPKRKTRFTTTTN
jgi:hypothetical protein